MGTDHSVSLEEDLIRISSNDKTKKQANNIAKAAESYYLNNSKACNNIINNISASASNTPVVAKDTHYQWLQQRQQRLVVDYTNLIQNDDDNWNIKSGALSQEIEIPSKLIILLKHDVLLNLSIASEYPLTPPKCTLDFSESKLQITDHPSIITENNAIILFEKIWCSSITLQDVIYFCSIIIQGEDPTDLVKNYIKLSQQRTINAMLTNNVMKDYLFQYTNPVCKCGAQMIQRNTEQCYVNEYSYVICDICDVICKKTYGIGKEIVYHCPRKKLLNVHPHGYDICFEDVYKNHLRFRQFNALIISPPIYSDADKIDRKDADCLTDMFKTLGYHNIVTLNEDQATKKRIKCVIDQMYHNNSVMSKVNIIVYTGHGFHLNNQFFFQLHQGKYLSEKQLMGWIDGHSKQLKSAVIDGYDTCKKIISDSTSLNRTNTLFLINACHSGAFKSIKTMKDNKSQIFSNVINDISHKVGDDFNEIINAPLLNDSKDMNDEKEYREILQTIDKGFRGLMSQISDNKHSALVIASCEKQETSNYTGQISPFIEYALDYLGSCVEEIKTASKTPVTSFCQLYDTPMKLYKYIEKRCNMPHPDSGIVWSDLANLGDMTQNVNLASQRGTDQFVLCPLY
eukprot:137426_1